MSARTARRAGSVVALLALAACASMSPPCAYRAGRADARRDFATGRAAILVVGFPAPDEGDVDAETGFPLRSRGCCRTETIDAYMRGYNDRMREASARGDRPRHVGIPYR